MTNRAISVFLSDCNLRALVVVSKHRDLNLKAAISYATCLSDATPNVIRFADSRIFSVCAFRRADFVLQCECKAANAMLQFGARPLAN